MSDLSAIQKAIEDGNRAFEAFKQANDQKGAAQSDKLATMEKAFADVTANQAEIKRMVEDIEAKAKRQGFGTGKSDDVTHIEQKNKEFAEFLRKENGTGAFEFDAKALAISTNSGADGGSAVPKIIDTMIESLVINTSPIRQIANVVQTSTNDYHKLVNLRGAASSAVGETASRPATNTPTIKDITINQYDIYANPQATQQMLDDVFFNAEQWLAEEIAEEFGRQEGALFVSGAGSGSNQPQGFLTPTYAATDDATRTFGQLQYVPTGVSGAFPASNPADILITLVSKMKAAYRRGSGWVMPKSALFTVAAFKDTSGRYIFNPITAPDVPATLLGYPVTEAEDMPAVAANSLSIAFGNFKRGYQIVDRVGTRIVRDPFSNKPYIGFYTVKRVGGAVINSEAIKALKFSVS
jgi:HK97 family phage major capsid protein